jgi:acyl-CoA thioester hydrolase
MMMDGTLFDLLAVDGCATGLTMSERLAREERRKHFLWWTEIASRWADCDAYGHVNNATYYSWFDTALTSLAIERGILRAPGQTSIGLCVSSECQFLAPVGFPETVDIGIRLGRLGSSSITYELAIFAKGADAAAAVCKFTHVYVDAATRAKVMLTAEQKRAVEDLVAGSTDIERAL